MESSQGPRALECHIILWPPAWRADMGFILLTVWGLSSSTELWHTAQITRAVFFFFFFKDPLCFSICACLSVCSLSLLLSLLLSLFLSPSSLVLKGFIVVCIKKAPA